MKKICICSILALFCCTLTAKADTTITSPDGQISVNLKTGAEGLGWTVSRAGKQVYSETNVTVNIGGKVLGGTAKVKSIKQRSAQETIRPVVPLKFAEINDSYNEATLNFGSYQMLLRVMNNGVAHRFVLNEKGDVEVMDEKFNLRPAEGFTAHYQTCGSFNTSYEEAYQSKSIGEWEQDGKTATIPCLLSSADDTQLLIGESDVDDYPRMFLKAENGTVTTTFPKAPIKWEPRGDRGENITQEADYIAKTSGRRALPWRWVAVTDSKGIIEQTIPVQLARRSALGDTSWIQPGKFSWEWWNGATPFGPDVDFKAGCNYETYCYFADFAAKYGIEYVLLDEGWAKSTRDPFNGNDHLRLPELIKYCNAKGVKLVLWLPWLTVEQNFDKLFKTYAEWGIPAVKIDFMDHADQWMVNFYKRVTAEAAKYHIIVDWHGSFTPAGLEQEYPNLVSYEGVRGLEQMGSCRPENTVFIPFIRNAVGPADFTPGGMNNMQPDNYRASRPNSGAMGTRAFQLALYVVLESGVQMLADNPTRYYQNDDCTRYIASVPTTWDETRCLEARAGEYVVVAKRKGSKWFIGAITNGTPRDLTLSLNFLGSGQHKLTAYKDGVNADYQAMHYNKVEQNVNTSSSVNIHLAKNGGWAAVIE
ncbi:MAG: glycoside hydrolase family 97 protein [Prevotella sp.]|nr:glycoside hydrolase family 97 protein [Prevotella sp.]